MITPTQEDSDERWMRLALEEALKAGRENEVPIGAVVVSAGGELLGLGRNERERTQDPCAHAEIIALRNASQKQRSFRLTGATLYVTLEPCLMCAGAIIHARIARVVYGCTDPKAGACETLYSVGEDARLNHRFARQSGVLAVECAELLKAFFSELRARNSLAKRAGFTAK